MSKQVQKSVDMSLPPEERGRKRKTSRIVATPPAQMDHASGPRARRLTRDGLRWLAAEEKLRWDTRVVVDETHQFADDDPRLREVPEWGNGEEAV